MTRLTGGCLCGAVRFELSAEPEWPHTCSCSMCRRHTGSLTAAWVEIASDAVTWTGPAGQPSVYRSSDASSRAFCPTCGSSIGAIDDKPVVALLVGSFDEPDAAILKPESHSYVSGRPHWWHVTID